jgi:hypothetical protein
MVVVLPYRCAIARDEVGALSGYNVVVYCLA